ncbi:mannitol dehydrogenase family protein [Nakamurella lactea]|uniref:mannitol dehydrogenase family protein n=1 Tax=Nakamurella lactea TaxID=459515 RepID=UPI0003FF3C05|nr:mannitol dehydrogenase family protein [Nakamurella lactea]
MTLTSLSRARDGRPAAPVRMVHLGLGNFFRAHQAYYTEIASDAADWGYLAFTGRSAVGPLRAQDGLYTLLVRGADADRPMVVSALSEVGVSTDISAWRNAFRLPALALVTLTVTEAGYCRNADGGLDTADGDVAADIAALRVAGLTANVSTVPGKLVLGLLHRRDAGLTPITLVPCDNVPGNGSMVARVVNELAELVDDGLPGWIEQNVGFVTTMVDRITPRAVPADRADLLAATGIDDPECVVTEPFTEWVLSGEFAAGHPDWAGAGARFVDDIEPWEHRKLWLLNGSHSLLAYAASIRGAETVAEAIADPVVRGWVDQWWDDAARQLPLPAAEIADYRAALLQRYANPRIRHLLAQIAADGSQKVPIRILPTLLGELAQGRIAGGATRVIAAWVLHLRGLGAPVSDRGATQLQNEVVEHDLPGAVRTVLSFLGVEDQRVTDAVIDQAGELSSARPAAPA